MQFLQLAILFRRFCVPLVHYKDHFIATGLPGSAGNANPSEWMQEDDFVFFLKHFHKDTKTTPEMPCLLLLDNHGSHLSIEGLNFAQANGTVML